MYYVYIARSLKDKKYYIGHTNNLVKRLAEHNRGKSKSVKYRAPFELVFSEEVETKGEAVRREKKIKRYKGGAAFKKLLNECVTPSSSLV